MHLQEIFALEREGAIEKPDTLLQWDETKVRHAITCRLVWQGSGAFLQFLLPALKRFTDRNCNTPCRGHSSLVMRVIKVVVPFAWCCPAGEKCADVKDSRSHVEDCQERDCFCLSSQQHEVGVMQCLSSLRWVCFRTHLLWSAARMISQCITNSSSKLPLEEYQWLYKCSDYHLQPPSAMNTQMSVCCRWQACMQQHTSPVQLDRRDSHPKSSMPTS